MTSNRIEEIVSSKHELEDHIDQLRELDKLRNKSAELRNKGLKALEEWLKQPRKVESDADPLIKADASLLQADVAVTLYHLSRNSESELLKKMEEAIDELSHLPPIEQDKHLLPVEDAAQNFHVLVNTPNSAFSEKALCFFYHILREIYTTDSTNWSIGGLRAAHGGKVSAYMTSLCLHALLDFAEAQENTAKLLGQIREFLEQMVVIANMPLNMPDLKGWKNLEIERLRYSYHLTLGRQSKSLVLCFKSPDPETDFLAYVFNEILCEPVGAIKQVQGSFENAIAQHEKLREQEKTDITCSEDNRKKFERSELGHSIAFEALVNGKKSVVGAIEKLGGIGFYQAINELKCHSFLEVMTALEKDGKSVEATTIDTIKTNLAVIIEGMEMVENYFHATAFETKKSRYPAENYLKGYSSINWRRPNREATVYGSPTNSHARRSVCAPWTGSAGAKTNDWSGQHRRCPRSFRIAAYSPSANLTIPVKVVVQSFSNPLFLTSFQSLYDYCRNQVPSRLNPRSSSS